ncbi:hypothetical protein EST38_g7830 [Candolleomyces aberdarensis]|uniref:DUF6533 domain-containing protein n=1 Tax=Candolleomyces aberdarensis TaxID=2316362 RepID=A0A4Q2DG68_9AGAR|nr:hypothetical protein EST38_g7830 [Candolleomyces aberdarensis]
MDEEYKRVWKARRTFGTSLFLCNRYLPPAIFFLDLTAQFRWNPTTELYVAARLAIHSPGY